MFSLTEMFSLTQQHANCKTTCVCLQQMSEMTRELCELRVFRAEMERVGVATKFASESSFSTRVSSAITPACFSLASKCTNPHCLALADRVQALELVFS